MISPSEAAGTASPLDLDLIRKYSVPGPRYTSYPAATQFTTELDGLGLEAAIEADNAPGAGPVSLYFHLPFCETRCWFCGCTTVITRNHGAAALYREGLEREIELTAARMDRGRPVAQIHFGGGTPTFFPPEELQRLGELIGRSFTLAPDVEFSVEIDPRRLTAEHVRALAEIGANRASLGVQDTDKSVQLAVHRYQPQELNERAFAWLRENGFRSINVDLIFGLPKQTRTSFDRTIGDVLSLGPDRLSVFSYAHVPWIKPAQRILEDQGLPGPEEKLAMFALAHRRLTEAGFVDIGLDHFARPDDSLARAQAAGTLHRNFQGYSTCAGASLYGFGMSSISSTAGTYRQNHRTLPAWKSAVDSSMLPFDRGLRLSEEDLRRRTIVMRIMCDRKLQFDAISREIGVDFPKTYSREIANLGDLEADGIVRRSSKEIEVTDVGTPLLRIVAMRFDAYYVPVEKRHAQAI
jgi:oxygen-independent coproporphyrinogen-3 oxidase